MLRVLLILLLGAGGAAVSVGNLKTEYLENPLGIDRAAPRFQWDLIGSERGLLQTSYRIKVGRTGADGSVWDSQAVPSARVYQVRYGGPPLTSGTVYRWAVTVTTEALPESGGETSVNATVTSATALFSMGMLAVSDWAAAPAGINAVHDGDAAPTGGQFIGPSADIGKTTCPWFRKTFTLLPPNRQSRDAGATPALLHLASVGYHELYINGQQADTEAVLLPSVSYLPKRVLYRTYNITALLAPAGRRNVIAIWASAGWGTYPDLDDGIATHAPLVLVKMTAGATTVVSDATWKVHASNLVSTGGGPGGGDAVDDGAADPTWNTADYDDSAWKRAKSYPVSTFPKLHISADIIEPTRRHSTVPAASVTVADAHAVGLAARPPPEWWGPASLREKPVRVDRRPSAVSRAGDNTTWLVTMKELYTGWFEVHNMRGAPGSKIHFQVSTTAGKPVEFGMEDWFTFGSSGAGSFRMRFAYHEIHYITISGLASAPAPADVVGYRLTSLGRRSGDFVCSSSLISQIYSTTVNNYRGLTTGGMSVDCPHRERRGYGGDGHTSYQFALANYPVGAFFNKWTRDFADVQGVPGGFGTPAGTGQVPNTAPTVGGGGGPAWSGFVVTNPWQTYNTFGDTQILEDMYPTMVKLLAFYANATRASDGLLWPWDASKWDFLGDWITPHGSESTATSRENLLFNNCYLHYITVLVARISAVLGDATAAARYRADAARIAAAVNKAFGDASTGVYVDTLQTHAVMPLATGVVPAVVAPLTWANLARQITVVDSGHLDTGLTGTYFMTKLLMEAGRNDLIFTFANKTDFPSYGHFLKLGYTTWPEEWNVAPGDSLMHGCYNAIGLWFVEGVAGIRVHASESPPLTIRPGVDAGDITWARGHRRALHGLAVSSWSLIGGAFTHNVTIPAGGVAKVMVPSASGATGVTEGGRPVASAPGVSVMGTATINSISYVSLRVLAGNYSFASAWKRH